MIERDDLTSLVYWFPKIEAAGLPVPRTHIVEAACDLTVALDGVTPECWDVFITDLAATGDEVGWPAFLRTSHGAGKHSWERTCFVPRRELLGHHVGALVEWSATVDLVGLPTRTWAIRELIDTRPLFRCRRYGNFPVVREFRVFTLAGDVVHVQPYWPPDAVKAGHPDDGAWRRKLALASCLTSVEADQLGALALRADRALGGGYWSIDFLQSATGEWWLTDMAEGERSFQWDP